MDMMNPSIFKSYDIRGVYPKDINEDNIATIVKAIFVVLYEKAVSFGVKGPITLLVGRDMRLSGPSLYPIVKNTLLECGANIVDIDLASTPTMYFATNSFKYDGGIQLSASHNPSQYAGLKIVSRDEKGLIKIGKGTGMEQIKELALDAQALDEKIKKLGLSKGTLKQKTDVLADEIKNAQKLVDFAAVTKPFKVVADGANAMGSLFIEALFKVLPGTLIPMNFKLDGSFPAHQPNPLLFSTMDSLRKRVIEEHADLGLAPDGDADRMFIVDERGEIVPCSILTALLARELLQKHPKMKMGYDIRYTMSPEKVIRDNGGTPVITKVGHALISGKMRDEDIFFSGESSGHYYFKNMGYAESQIPTIVMVLAAMSRENKPISEIVKELSFSFESGEFNFKTDKVPQILDLLKKTYVDGKIMTIDGVAFDFGSWRFGVRSSNTEPLLRLNVEARDKKEMEAKRDELIALIKTQGAELVIE